MTQNEVYDLVDAVKMFASSYDDLMHIVESIKDDGTLDLEPANAWIDAKVKKPASDDELVVVMTDAGAKYFGRTIGGKFQKNVVRWFPLPKEGDA